MADLQKLLNEKQYEAATSTSKYLRIIAGAGSGKTRVLTYRIAHLIDNLGYRPSSIVAITFTNKAANEIRRRIEDLINKGNHVNMFISTFHSFCARILREECKAIDYPSNFSVIDEEDQKKIVKDIIKEKEYDPKELKVTSILDYIANKKNGWVSPENDLKHTEGNEFNHKRSIIYSEYENYLAKNFALDFDDLILKTIKIFKERPEILEKWQNRISHILVDEFQDVDPNQYQLVILLAGNDNEVTVVGDPDQTIYTWRGADINIILNFDKDFIGAKTISLEENYRSSGKILEIANKLISHNVKRIPKNLFTKSDMGPNIIRYEAENEAKEAKFVINNIIDLYDGKTTMYRNCAILYRTNAQSAALEQELMSNGIKYMIFGGMKFYRRAEVKDCIAYLKLATNFQDNLSCERLLENCGKGIGKTTIEKIKANSQCDDKSIFVHLKDSKDELLTLYKPKQGKSLQIFVEQMLQLHDQFVLEPLKAYTALDDHLHKYGYIDILIANEEDERLDNVKTFLNQMKDYFKQEDATLEGFIQDVSLMSAQDEIDDDSDSDYVNLMTIHTAKGLEFDNVFVYGLVDGIFPSDRSIQESVDGIEEERRLFYVAITRARKRLFLSTSGGMSYNGPRRPSRFLKEVFAHAMRQNVKINEGTIKFGPTPSSIRAGSLIKHDTFGEGIVLSENNGIIVVVFKDVSVGKKTLIASHKAIHLVK